MAIKILDENTINKISAGEVVERPLNVVKELVENALDANADTISVEIEKSGKKFISVCDNGCGMNKDDLQMSICRHATNKITNFDDLSNTFSLGFRGEALPSIASISMFTIKTQQHGQNSGWQLSMNGESKPEVQPWAGAYGTTVEVRNLFFNTPAREKFLKSDITEKAKIISCLDEIALVRNDINLKVVSDGKVVSDYHKTDSKLQRIEDVLGKNISQKLKHISFGHPKVEIDGYITTRQNSFPQKNMQYLFVNGRCVNYPKWLIHAIYQASKEAIPIGRHPGIILFLKTNPSDIDINVHPTKREIKFVQENQMYELFYSFIKSSLESDAPANIINVQNDSASKDTSNSTVFIPPEYKHSGGYGNVRYPSRQFSVKDYQNVYQTSAVSKEETSTTSVSEPVELKQTDLIQQDNFKFIGQIFETYILVEKEKSFYIIDQHAAQERVRYEMFSNQLEQKSLKIQQLLIPDVFELQKSKSILLKNNLEVFKNLGFDVEEFGDNSFRLTAYPALLGNNVNFIEIIDVLVGFLEEEKTTDVEQIKEKIIRASCRTSIKAGDKIYEQQAKALLRELFACKMPWTCPHGRPTVYTLTLSDLEKFFKRI